VRRLGDSGEEETAFVAEIRRSSCIRRFALPIDLPGAALLDTSPLLIPSFAKAASKPILPTILLLRSAGRDECTKEHTRLDGLSQ